MTVRKITMAENGYELTGVGYDPHGSVRSGQQEVDIEASPLLQQIARASLLCNDASLIAQEDGWQINGDPTEAALLVLAMKLGLETDLEHEKYPRTDVIPFESEHRFMATLHHDHEGNGHIYMKGAPEVVLERCRTQYVNGCNEPLDRDFWLQQVDALAADGQRVLALAYKPVAADKLELFMSDVEGDLCLLGLIGMIDPPRQEAIQAVAQCRAAGINVKMITGDHAATALAIARQLGLKDGQHALTGQDRESLTDEILRERVMVTDVFARTSPEHKLRLVKALQAKDKVVAMTGDGVNDAPALKQAEVGIAMGKNGTEAAKEAAEMVLADDNFATIAHAIEEGRTVYDNIKKSILFILPTNGGEAFTMIAAVALGRMFPLTAAQILWVNMITAVTLALALAFEPKEKDIMQRPPRNPHEPLLSPYFIWRIFFVSAILVAGTFGLFLWHRNQGVDIETARTIAVNTLVMFEILYLFNSRFLLRPVLNREGLFGSRIIWIAIGILVLFQLAFTYLPTLQILFQTRPLDAHTWLQIFVVSSSVLFLVELEKFFVQKRGGRGN